MGVSTITELRIVGAREEVEYVGKVNMNELYIQLPIMMAARLNLGKITCFPKCRPVYCLGVGGKTSGEMEEYDYSSEYNPNRSYRFRIDTFGNRIDDKMGNKRFDAGLCSASTSNITNLYSEQSFN